MEAQQSGESVWVPLQTPLTSLPPLPARKQSIVNPSPTPGSSSHPISRVDGRGLFEMRRIFMKTGVLLKAEGSCYLSQGKTRLLCSVFGPKSNRNRGNRIPQEGELIVEVTFSPFCHKGLGRVTKAGGGTGQSNRNFQDVYSDEISRLSSCIVQAFRSVVLTDQFCNSAVEICILVIQSDDCLISSSINCVSLALADARIPMRDICTGTTIYMVDLSHVLSSSQSVNRIPSEDMSNSRPRKVVDLRRRSNEQEDGVSSIHQLDERFQHPIYLVDPTLDEIKNGPFRIFESGILDEVISIERCSALLHLGLCSTEMYIVFLDAAGIPFESPIDGQIIQLAESACCATAKAFKEQLKTQYLEQQANETTEVKLVSEFIDIVNSLNTGKQSKLNDTE